MDRRALIGLSKPGPAKTSGGGGGGAANAYLPLPTITATVTRPGGRRGVFSVETGVDVADAALRLRAEQSAPRLRAAYAEVCQRTAQAMLPGAPPDILALSRDLQAATDRVLGRAGARLLLGTVMAV
ncbi:MAG TPA: Tat pathway signal protein [Brevundimonas sp.]|uniref:Tat pathway signal protein n=1 Tax=Brevundimonas sp. TaxID=1871086 RepID=UPI002639ABF9|nr:Tat pathway signal protein [Brevundimonas sp.]HRO34452.1 Tat pathway signal protein [Brevundimonas sp.]